MNEMPMNEEYADNRRDTDDWKRDTDDWREMPMIEEMPMNKEIMTIEEMSMIETDWRFGNDR